MSLRATLALLCAVTLFAPLAVHAQGTAQDIDTTVALANPLPEPLADSLPDSLPDSPGVLVARLSAPAIPSSSSAASTEESLRLQQPSGAGQSTTAAGTAPAKHTGHLVMTVQVGEVADPMSARDKFVGGLRDSVSLFAVAGWLSSALWEQLWNSSPNYGSDAGAFGQRLGAAAIRGGSQTVFSEAILAPLFREDPRYYVMGSKHNFFKRVIYAGTRPILTRTDAGHQSVNFAVIGGNYAGAALTPTYYPSQNTSATEVAWTFAGSMGGSAVGNLVDEFIVDALVQLHLKKQQP